MKSNIQSIFLLLLVAKCDSFQVLGPGQHCSLRGNSFRTSLNYLVSAPCKRETIQSLRTDICTKFLSCTALSLSTRDESQHSTTSNSISSGFDGILKLPFIKAVMNFAKWLVFALRSVLLVRLTWILHVTSKFKKMLLDPRYRMVTILSPSRFCVLDGDVCL